VRGQQRGYMGLPFGGDENILKICFWSDDGHTALGIHSDHCTL